MRTLTLSKFRLQYVLGNIALAFAYYGAAELSRWLASTPQNVTPVWPPDGIAVGAVFLYGYPLLPGVCLGSFLANILAFWDPSNWSTVASSVMGVGAIALGTTLGTCAGVFGLRRAVGDRYPLHRVHHVVKLLVFAGLLGPVSNATVGVAVLCALGIVPWAAYQSVWLTWWISNVAGIFIVTPAMISWENGFRQENRPTARVSEQRLARNAPDNLQSLTRQRRNSGIETLLIAGLIAGVGKASFWQSFPLEYMMIPLLMWATFRHGPKGASLAALGISSIAILGTVRGLGTFASEDLNQSLTLLQSFVAVTVFTALILAAVLAERGEAELKLKVAVADLAHANQELEQRVEARTVELANKNDDLQSTLQELHQMQAQIVQSEKMSSLGQMVAGIAHEINNPVNFIHGNLRHLKDYTSGMLSVLGLYQQHYPDPAQEIQKEADEHELDFILSDTTKLLDSMEEGTERISSIVLSLRNFSRLDESDCKLADIHEGLESTLLVLKHRLSLPGHNTSIQLIKDYGEIPAVECFPGSLNQAFMNILANAIDALEQHLANLGEEPPTITLRTARVDDWVKIAIADNGPGLSEVARQKVFDPFFTTKPVGKGTGMGMSISYQIITQRHHGKLTFGSVPDKGAEFVIQIPLQQPLPQTPPPTTEQSAPQAPQITPS